MPTEPQMPGEADGRPMLAAYKTVCAKLGLTMIVYFVCRILGGYATHWFGGLALDISHTAAYVIGMVLTIVLVYIVPLLVTAIVFKSFGYYSRSGGLTALYKKPRRLARALGTFPAMYGLGYGIALLTLLASFLFSRLFTGWHTVVEDLLQPTAIEPSSDIVGALMLVFLMVVIAPVFEEIWVRGIMYDALKPFGCGIAIVISSVIFGLMHGSFQMLFYTTALGFALGYIRYATGSIFVPTILHFIINSVAAGLLLLSSLVEITNDGNRLLNSIFNIYVLAVLVLIVVGVVTFFKRIPTIRKYRVENAWAEISPGKKAALFFASVPVIIMLVLAFNEHTQGWLLNLIVP